MFVVDIERYNDGEEGLHGPFTNRDNAWTWALMTLEPYSLRWASIREVAAP